MSINNLYYWINPCLAYKLILVINNISQRTAKIVNLVITIFLDLKIDLNLVLINSINYHLFFITIMRNLNNNPCLKTSFSAIDS